MNGFVLDASVALGWCFRDEANAKTASLLQQIKTSVAFVPSIFPLEIGNILVGAQKKSRITFAEMTKYISLLERLNIQIDDETSAHAYHEILQLSYQHKLTTYDAAYLELALRFDVPLATKDPALASVSRKLGIEVL
jgi:predicted nucleic acid-binding protein